ncbi:TlpA disulfide reductase family protein [Neptuniibacter sp. QD48_11]|uniref:TlpA disulfide reductase family protein n=1 Tax=unclassified Neptuniibacter TaxID=2630693 RepID=UPI0039F59C2D
MSFLKSTLISIFLFATSANALAQSELYKLSFQNTDHEMVSLANYKGKVVLLNFWATWCPPCIKEMPSMQRLQEHFADQEFEIVAINAGEDSVSVSSFLMELDTELTFTILLDEKNRSFNEFGIKGLPMTLLFDKEGKLIETILGGKEWDHPESIALISKTLN